MQDNEGNLELAVNAFMEQQDKPKDMGKDLELVEDDKFKSVTEVSQGVSSNLNVKIERSRKVGAKRRLDEIFARPSDISFNGYTFEELRFTGNSERRWLLVDVHCTTEFACVCLNRDIWSDSLVRSILRDHFIFWQCCHGIT